MSAIVFHNAITLNVNSRLLYHQWLQNFAGQCSNSCTIFSMDAIHRYGLNVFGVLATSEQRVANAQLVDQNLHFVPFPVDPGEFNGTHNENSNHKLKLEKRKEFIQALPLLLTAIRDSLHPDLLALLAGTNPEGIQAITLQMTMDFLHSHLGLLNPADIGVLDARLNMSILNEGDLPPLLATWQDAKRQMSRTTSPWSDGHLLTKLNAAVASSPRVAPLAVLYNQQHPTLASRSFSGMSFF